MEQLDTHQVTELRDALRRLKSEIEETLDRSKEAAQPVQLDQQAIGRVSRIDAIQQQKMVEANRARQRIRLAHVRAALTAIEEDTYGECLHCEEPIAYKRLLAKPESRICLHCQAALEQKR